MDTVAACGDVCRNVLCTSRPDVCLLAPHVGASWSTEQWMLASTAVGTTCWAKGKVRKSGQKIERLLLGLLARKINLLTQKRCFFPVFPTASWTLLAWFETRGSKELHSEILHYTYDIHDHCLPRFLVRINLNEWTKKKRGWPKAGTTANNWENIWNRAVDAKNLFGSTWEMSNKHPVKHGINIYGCRIFLGTMDNMKVSPAARISWTIPSIGP